MPVMMSYKVIGLIGLSSYALGLLTSRLTHLDHHRAQVVAIDRSALPTVPRGYTWRAMTAEEVAQHPWHYHPCVPEDWMQQGLACLIVHDRRGELAGLIWASTAAAIDRQLNLRITPPPGCAVDTGLWIPDDRRMTRAFAAVMGALGEWMDAQGAARSISTITDHNLASIAAHQRLGATTIGFVRVIRIGRWQWTLGGRPGISRPHRTVPDLSLRPTQLALET